MATIPIHRLLLLAADKTLENYPILCYALIGFSIERHSEMKLHQMIVRCHTITPGIRKAQRSIITKVRAIAAAGLVRKREKMR